MLATDTHPMSAHAADSSGARHTSAIQTHYMHTHTLTPREHAHMRACTEAYFAQLVVVIGIALLKTTINSQELLVAVINSIGIFIHFLVQ